MTDDVGILGIKYDELDDDPQSTYAGAVATVGRTDKVFYSKGEFNVHRDVIAAWNWTVDQGVQLISFSSSFDHFLMDGENWKYDEKRIIVPNK